MRRISVLAMCWLLACSVMTASGQQRGGDRGPRRERSKSLQVGNLAPTFSLKSLDGTETFDLRSYRDKRPVLLLFGSYT